MRQLSLLGGSTWTDNWKQAQHRQKQHPADNIKSNHEAGWTGCIETVKPIAPSSINIGIKFTAYH
jgi:hypothetical protein